MAASQFIIKLNGDNESMSVHEGTVSIDAIVYGEQYGYVEGRTDSVSVQIGDGPEITMCGDAWREISAEDLEGFLKLMQLDYESATLVARMASSDTPIFRTRLSGEASASCIVFSGDEGIKLNDRKPGDSSWFWDGKDSVTNVTFGSMADDMVEISLAEMIDNLTFIALSKFSDSERERVIQEAINILTAIEERFKVMQERGVDHLDFNVAEPKDDLGKLLKFDRLSKGIRD